MRFLNRLLDSLLFWGGFIFGVVVMFQKVPKLLRSLLIQAADNDTAKQWVSSSAGVSTLVRQYVAGPSADEAVATARVLTARGFDTIFAPLLPASAAQQHAQEACEHILTLIDTAPEQLDKSTLQLDLRAFGQLHNRQTVFEHLLTIGQTAAQVKASVQIASVPPDYAQELLRLVRDYRAASLDNLIVTLPTQRYRSFSDAEQLLALGVGICLTDDPLPESAETVFPSSKQVMANETKLIRLLLSAVEADGAIVQFATETQRFVQNVINTARTLNINTDRFAFQMRYGGDAALQDHLVQSGYTVRLLLPYGHDWSGYLLKRMAAQPSQLEKLLIA